MNLYTPSSCFYVRPPLFSAVRNPCHTAYRSSEQLTPGGLILAVPHPDAAHPATQAQPLQNSTALDV